MIKKNNCCFKCLKRGHRSIDCKVKIICSWCKQRHSILICPTLHNNNNVSSNSNIATIDKASDVNIQEQNLANFCNLPQVYLQNLRVILYSDDCEKIIRVVIDSGSQRSYIRSEIVKELGYIPI